jgi:phosphoglycolate phosphatase
MECLLFDLDGTLVDTAPEITDAVNDSLARLGAPAVGESQVRAWIGEGAQALFNKALAHAGLERPGAALWKTLWSGFELDYLERCGTRSRVFPGVKPALEKLRERGLRLAVLTNKESSFAHRVLVRHGLSDCFELIVAGDTLPDVRKPDARIVQHVLQSLDVEVDEALLIGDLAIDVRTARAAGIAVWAVRHGYAHSPLEGADAPDRFLDHFDDLPDAIAQADRVSIY